MRTSGSITIGVILFVLVVALGGRVQHAASGPQSDSAPSEQLAALQSAASVRSSNVATTLYLPLVQHLYDTRVRLFGVQAWQEINNPQALAYMSEAGVRWFRTTISWRTIEPAPLPPSQYDWTATDQRVSTLVQAGFRPIITLADNPSWAAALPGGPVTNTQDLVEFMSALVERYDGDGLNDVPGSLVVRHWEFYNEPDNTDYGWHCSHAGLGCFGNDPDRYAQELAAVYPAIKAASPDAQLVFGGIAMDNFSLFNPNFLDEVLAACTGTCFDIMNFHYYPFYRFPPEGGGHWEPYGRDILGKATAVRNKLAAYGYMRPLVVTEANWPSGSYWGSDELQARYVPKLYARGMAADLGVLIWYKVTDETCEPISFMSGLLTCNYMPKPSHTAYSVFTTELGRADYVAAVSQSDPLIESYQFQVPETNSTRRVDVTWVDCTVLRGDCTTPMPPTPRPYRVQAELIRLVDKMGNAATLSDCFDGIRDGYISLQWIDQSPVYVEYLQLPQATGTPCPQPTPGPTSTPGLPPLATATPRS